MYCKMRRSISGMMIHLRGVFLIFIIISADGVLSDPQTKLLMEDCSQYKFSIEMSKFMSHFNETFADIRRQLSSNSNVHFATAAQMNVYGMVQCRNYLSSADCVACLDAGFTEMRRYCPTNNGGHVIYQGCTFWYDSHDFYGQSVLFADKATAGVCSKNLTKIEGTNFTMLVQESMKDLVATTPKIIGFFAAVARPVSDNDLQSKVYAVAQCWETLSQNDCQNCLTIGYNNLKSCPPGSDGSTVDTGCFLRYSDASFFADYSTIDITPNLREGGTSHSKTSIIVGVVGGSCFLLLILVALLWYQFVRKPSLAKRGDVYGITKLQGLVIYSFKDLKLATRNFSVDFKIGEGGFGDVYKGTTKNGDVVAVKKLAIATSKAKADFVSEVRLMSNANHRNIIRLLGFSDRGSELLLVFEYMANGSLDTFLYGEKRGSLGWKQRVDIILGIARGLVYLHEQFHLCVIHRDIKSSNILLNDDLQPKISDFGLARHIRDDQSHLSTRFAGTMGYTAPEYAIHGHLSEKVDTYSFGVVVLEIVSGQKCTNMEDETPKGSLLEHAWDLYTNDMHSDLVDETLDPNEYVIDNIKMITELALMCTQSPTSRRPTMSEVVVLLTNEHPIELKPPGKPIIF